MQYTTNVTSFSPHDSQAISAIDLALWDVLGKLRNEPVYALLGGKTKVRLPTWEVAREAHTHTRTSLVMYIQIQHNGVYKDHIF